MKFRNYIALALALSAITSIAQVVTTNFVVQSNWFSDAGGNKAYFRENILPTLVNPEFDEAQFTTSNNVVSLIGYSTNIVNDINTLTNKLDNLTNSLQLVAFTGDYNDLTNKPIILDPLFNGEIVDKNFIITNTIDSVQFAPHLDEFYILDYAVTNEVPGTKFDGKSFTTFTKNYDESLYKDILVTNKFKLPYVFDRNKVYEDTLVVDSQLSHYLAGSNYDDRFCPDRPLYYSDSEGTGSYYLDNYKLSLDAGSDHTSYQAGKLINNDNTYYLPNSQDITTNLNVLATKQDIENSKSNVVTGLRRPNWTGTWITPEITPLIISGITSDNQHSKVILSTNSISILDDQYSFLVQTNVVITPHGIITGRSHDKTRPSVTNNFPLIPGRLAVVDQIPSTNGLVTETYVDNHEWSWSSITNAPNMSDYALNTNVVHASYNEDSGYVIDKYNLSVPSLMIEVNTNSDNRIILNGDDIFLDMYKDGINTTYDNDDITRNDLSVPGYHPITYSFPTNSGYFALTKNTDGTPEIPSNVAVTETNLGNTYISNAAGFYAAIPNSSGSSTNYFGARIPSISSYEYNHSDIPTVLVDNGYQEYYERVLNENNFEAPHIQMLADRTWFYTNLINDICPGFGIITEGESPYPDVNYGLLGIYFCGVDEDEYWYNYLFPTNHTTKYIALTDDPNGVVDGNYLPITGGTINGSLLVDETLRVGTNVVTISKHSQAFGNGSTSGLKGYKYINTGSVSNSLTFEVIPEGWSVNDVVSIVNKDKYINCATISNINSRVITFNENLPFNNIIEESDFDSKCVYVISKPDKGNIDLGMYSYSEGWNAKANNIAAHAEGRDTLAYGNYSHTEGRNTEANYIAHAEGHNSKAHGFTSHAEGYGTTASGDNSHSEGQGTKSSGKDSHSEGYNTVASGFASHAEGGFSTTPGGKAIGNGSHAEGVSTESHGDGSHAENIFTKSYGYSSHSEGVYSTTGGEVKPNTIGNFSNTGYAAHAEGNGTWAVGSSSHAEGYSTIASNFTAHAEGNQTIALGQNSHVGGLKSIAEGNTSYAIGRSSHAFHDRSFVWSGLDTDTKYLSRGLGTFNINPVGGAEGFYIGENNLSNIVVSLAPQVKKYDESTNPTGYLTYDDFINLLDKAMTTGLKMSDGKTYKLVCQDIDLVEE